MDGASNTPDDWRQIAAALRLDAEHITLTEIAEYLAQIAESLSAAPSATRLQQTI